MTKERNMNLAKMFRCERRLLIKRIDSTKDPTEFRRLLALLIKLFGAVSARQLQKWKTFYIDKYTNEYDKRETYYFIDIENMSGSYSAYSYTTNDSTPQARELLIKIKQWYDKGDEYVKKA